MAVRQARKIRLGEDEAPFSLEFWQKLDSEARFAAVWDATVDLVRMGKLDEAQLRLRRSVARVIRNVR